MAIGLLATIAVGEGMTEGFERAFLDLAEQMRANEPVNYIYALHRSGTDSQVYKVMEQCASQEALAAHSESDYFREAKKILAGLVAAAPEIELLPAVAR